ncbi:hypothetical protein [Halogranum rubrum]|uniref:Uncharacterized protein n=1 Tax=Halogranum salarium B-1 TaxID=1210908 RepID=J3JDN3_9EURY|nr:hypothetical protein [Halogranum salarium]EJN57639.1 hypothetical protein HSB1_40000 [Halogranum salarium B-1]
MEDIAREREYQQYDEVRGLERNTTSITRLSKAYERRLENQSRELIGFEKRKRT